MRYRDVVAAVLCYKDKTVTSTGQLDPRLYPLLTGSSDQILAAQGQSPIAGFENSNPAPVAGMSPLSEEGFSATPYAYQTPSTSALALQSIMGLTDTAGGGSSPDYSNIPALAQLYQLVQPNNGQGMAPFQAPAAPTFTPNLGTAPGPPQGSGTPLTGPGGSGGGGGGTGGPGSTPNDAPPPGPPGSRGSGGTTGGGGNNQTGGGFPPKPGGNPPPSSRRNNPDFDYGGGGGQSDPNNSNPDPYDPNTTWYGGPQSAPKRGTRAVSRGGSGGSGGGGGGGGGGQAGPMYPGSNVTFAQAMGDNPGGGGIFGLNRLLGGGYNPYDLSANLGTPENIPGMAYTGAQHEFGGNEAIGAAAAGAGLTPEQVAQWTAQGHQASELADLHSRGFSSYADEQANQDRNTNAFQQAANDLGIAYNPAKGIWGTAQQRQQIAARAQSAYGYGNPTGSGGSSGAGAGS